MPLAVKNKLGKRKVFTAPAGAAFIDFPQVNIVDVLI